MKILQALQQKSARILTKENASFSYPIAWQKKELSRFPEPVDDIERSYFQYRCQMRLAKRCAPTLLNAASLLLLPLFQLKLSRQEPVSAQQPTDAVFAYEGRPNILPNSLQQVFPRWVQCSDFQNCAALNANDIRFLRRLRYRYPFSFFFRFKCMLKIAMYRSMLDQYAPKAVIVSEEYSFTSSLLTAYCREQGVEHINVMHGEKGYYIRDSFFHFDRCYVWSEFYQRLFMQLRAEPSQFLTELPPALLPWTEMRVEKEVDYTYYLQAEYGTALRIIAAQLNRLRSSGCTVAVRLHPVYSDRKAVSQIFDGCIVEDPKKMPIETSILRTRHVIAKCSTVLLQAHINGVPIVIDDVSEPENFHKLQEMQYHILECEHFLLSELPEQER